MVTSLPRDFSIKNIEIYNIIKPYTMTSPKRINALIDAVDYIEDNNIDGDIVECGVWKGGSSMAIALALKKRNVEQRNLYLYDTFSGMSHPSKVDQSLNGEVASIIFPRTLSSDGTSEWCNSSIEEVRRNLEKTKYNQEKIHFIKGKVEDTIPNYLPNEIAILRLDTDWYESTKHELIHLFPLLRKNGVLIIDDYGHWLGARKAVDEYIEEKNIRILLNRIDYTGRMAIKS
jgi:hypothetical protein